MIHLRQFTGELPAVPNQLLPENAAQIASNADLRNGEIAGLFGALPVFSSAPAGTKGIYTEDGQHLVTSQTPMRAFKAPTVDDVYDRVYFTNGDGFRVSCLTDATASGSPIASWKVGVPTPTAALTVEKVRKNRWPNYPNTALKAKLFFEDAGRRYGETLVDLTQKAGSIAFSAYTFDAGINVTQTLLDAAVAASISSIYPSSKSVAVTELYFTAATVVNLRHYAVGWNVLGGTQYVVISASNVTLANPWDGNGEAPAESVFASSFISKVKLPTGVISDVVYGGATAATGTATPATATPCVEVWLENLDNIGERIWTAYTGASISAGAVSSFPGGAEVTLMSTGATTFEINISYGITEDRAYVYTMVNDWNEESQPSEPAALPVTYLDDVVLRVDYDACAEQMTGYRSLNHLQLYCATNGDYVAINMVPSSASTVTDLFHSLLWREPAAAGLAYWTAQYDKGMSLSDISAYMMQSPEYVNPDNYLIVEDLYIELLGRAPLDAGWYYWEDRLSSGVALRVIIKEFLYSAEFATLHPSLVVHSTNDAAVSAQVTWYFNATVNRAPASDGLAYWVAKIKADYNTTVDLIYSLMRSAEYVALSKTRHITSILTVALDRAPTGGEIAAATAKYDANMSYTALAMTSASVDTVGFIDEGTSRTKGWTLPSLTWAPPFSDMRLLTMLNNGVLSGVRGNNVYFSEPYLPYAWPSEYIQSIPSDVVGAMAYDGQLLITTTSAPLVISGAHPGGMTQQRIGAGEAGVSEFGLVSVSGRPVYASKEGLVLINGTTGSLDLSHQFWSSEEWRALYGSRLGSIRLLAHDGKLIALFDSGDGFVAQMDGSQPHIVAFSQVGGYPFSVPGEESLYLATGTSNLKLFFGSQVAYQWRSKEFTLPSPSNFGAVKVVADGAATLTFYGDNALIHTVSITSSGLKEHLLRLPSGMRYCRFSFAIAGTARVQEVHIATTMREIANG